MNTKPFQKAVCDVSDSLKTGNKYTMFYLSDFGFPVARKVKFDSYALTSYAQYSDVVRFCFVPYRGRKLEKHTFYNKSLAIFKGWQDYPDTAWKEKISDFTTMTKYHCFDSRYFSEGLKYFKNPVLIYDKDGDTHVSDSN